MPELLTKHPDIMLEILAEQGARCGMGVRPKILKSCPQKKLCVLQGNEFCVFGPTELGLMTELTRSEVCGPVPLPRADLGIESSILGFCLAALAVTGLGAVAASRRRRLR